MGKINVSSNLVCLVMLVTEGADLGSSGIGAPSVGTSGTSVGKICKLTAFPELSVQRCEKK
jgi:hypothetical protein